MRALVVTYHAIDDGPAPLSIDSLRFAAQLDALARCGARTLTMSGLLAGIRSRSLPPRAVILTFDDGLETVVTHAAPLLAERGMTATVFCVAARLGGDNRWPTRLRAPRPWRWPAPTSCARWSLRASRSVATGCSTPRSIRARPVTWSPSLSAPAASSNGSWGRP